ncbi:Crp/Fnr family transcriptional regulator [Aquiflexum gelatinilyticum]|uniref:Crp/Fnr family transcriptional regulator n=1 Tax=Aquiflexum gelatinilyticum TaxID=2961943 RepID=A0A9X2PCG7_9BACT|nr:Crp/Fnr family transcriptional regulator [Aquiflexum gelatinilyticum]MCR9017009.1 Crp/Fnr family transcriptional regulator [Aquiflexum gelatinilyticum]
MLNHLSASDKELLYSRLKPVFIKKGEYITLPGQVQENLYLVHSGVQMSFFENEKKMHVVAFTYSGEMCAVPESFFFQKPSRYAIKCLSDSEMNSISFSELNALFDESRSLERFFRKATESVLSGVINRHLELHTLSIEERFRSFAARSPQLFQLVPHKYIASYLGIDPTNFSKLYNSIKI